MEHRFPERSTGNSLNGRFRALGDYNAKTAVLDTLAYTTSARFTLIRDDGERDREVYSRYPGRVERLVIRDVSTPERRREVERLLTPLEVPFAFLPPAGYAGP